MKLLPKHHRAKREDSLGHGMDAVVMLMLFFGAGFGLDRLFGTTPLFMIGLTVLGAVGLFAKFWYRYEAKMKDHEDARRRRVAGAVPRPAERDRAA